jgi:uncharacterized protein (TIGR03083 family)
MDAWATLADERRTLADELEGMPAERWSAVTTCGGWTVHELTAHLTVPLDARRTEVLASALRARGNLDRAIASMTTTRASKPSQELVATLRDRAGSRFHPPGMGVEAPLTDAVIHGIELRRAAGLSRRVGDDALRVALDFVTSGKARGFVAGGRTKDLRFEPTDLDWSGGDAGAPVVRGAAEDLLLAITGRASALDALEGEGVALLALRL